MYISLSAWQCMCFNVYVYLPGWYLLTVRGCVFVNDEANELSISRSILSITVQSGLTLIGGDANRNDGDWLTVGRVMGCS